MNIIEIGDCRETMRRWAAQGIKAQTCVTSPPYYGLRDYGVEPTVWPEMIYRTLGGEIHVPAMTCGLGLEPSPDAFIGHMVLVFRAVRDVLADDGTAWVNIGDSYANDGKWGGSSGGKHAKGLHGDTGVGRGKKSTGLKPKDLMGIPWALAFALRADGWFLRQGIVWNKPNPMPESVQDRCTKAHEDIFLLAKQERYLFDADAIKEPAAAASIARWAQNIDGQRGSDRVPGKTIGPMKAVGGPRSARDSFKRSGSKRAEVIPGQTVGTHRPDREESTYDTSTRNKRSVWTVATRPYKGAHFATFPPDLIRPCILAGSREGDIVLDPFMGSGTTAQVALQHGRRYLGCELNPEYGALQRQRIAEVTDLFTLGPSGSETQPLEA